jgi:hypothetical protein
MKCKYWKKCPLYKENSMTCNKYEGDYGNKKASCKIKMEKKDE